AGTPGGPAIVRNGAVIYFAHPIFKQYNQNAPRWCKQLLLNALDLLLPDPLVRHGGPSTLLTTLNEQAAQQRWVLHLLHYIPERRGMDFDVIEDVIPLYDLPLSVRVDRPVQRVKTAPQGAELPFSVKEGRVEFTLPRLDGHQMVEISFGE
ncbi:MAG TPA: beta-galactosidase, partial [Caldilineaceae bacterium]|nr:beta-galactosidase [Caldilineaceae bacterium]